ncbi:hypothetical protein D3A96_07945 [Robertkochia marina]|nr:hypothetical protein D3A96_07945 [Robertkochia marina]
MIPGTDQTEFHTPDTNSREEINAGDDLKLVFENIEADSRLMVSSAYAKTILSPVLEGGKYVFEFPHFISHKAGMLSWRLFNSSADQFGEVYISPGEKPEYIENYLGPRSIQAGGTDYSMLVSIPTDSFDNPLMDGVKVEISEFFNDVLKKEELVMNHMLVWKRVISKRQTGSIFIASSVDSVHSKEMISEVYPSLPTDFNIEIQRVHTYADGNQVTEIKTSTIRDAFENIVSDGTSVEFLIADSDNNLRKTYGNTIDGVARAQLLHPEKPDSWVISARIPGMALSNKVEITYDPVIKDFEVRADPDHKKIRVGPLTSFLGQFVPDGTEVLLEVGDNDGSLYYKYRLPSKAGMVTFKIPEDLSLSDSYIFTIKSLGVTKIFSLKPNAANHQ